MTPAQPDNTMSHRQRRGFWMRTLHQWHWISASVCLISMLMFAITGLTLNHANLIPGTQRIDSRMLVLPEALLDQVAPGEADTDAPLPPRLRGWLSHELDIPIGRRTAEWTPDEIYLSMPAPGRDAWLSIDRATGDVEYERTTRGWVSYFNDLHRGRNAGPAWGWFIDLFALSCVVFTVTGLFLLQLHARQRRMTWPLVGLGLVVPVVLALIFIH